MTASVVSLSIIEVAWDEVPAIHQNGIITHYEVRYIQTTSDNTTLENNSTIDSQTFITNLTELERVEYSIQVRAYTTVGAGPFSDVVHISTTQECKSIVYIPCCIERRYVCTFIPLTVPMSPPGNVTATAVSSTTIQVTWEEISSIDNEITITQYEVEYNQSTFSMIPTSTSVIENSMTFNVNLTGLQEYVEYSIQVRAYSRVGPGPYSDVVMETTLQDCKKSLF